MVSACGGISGRHQVEYASVGDRGGSDTVWTRCGALEEPEGTFQADRDHSQERPCGRRLRRGVFTSVPELITTIDEYIAHHNTHPKPFIWTKSARDILQKVIRANNRLSAQQNETLH